MMTKQEKPQGFFIDEQLPAQSPETAAAVNAAANLKQAANNVYTTKKKLARVKAKSPTDSVKIAEARAAHDEALAAHKAAQAALADARPKMADAAPRSNDDIIKEWDDE